MRCITQRTYVKRVPTAKKGGIEQTYSTERGPYAKDKKEPIWP